MATLTLKNLPDDLHRRLKERAAQNRRSLNNEVIDCLEKVLASDGPDPESYLAHIRPLRARTTRLLLTEDLLRAAREEGRS